MVTIADVARAAGVSRTAVSFAFNDPGRLSSDTRDRILAVAQELGYFPNPVARSLINKRVGALGLLIPQRTATLFANPFFAELLRGIGHVCDRHDFAVLLVPPVQGSITRALSRALADGFVVVGLEEAHPAITMLRQRTLPFVTVDGPPLPQVSAVNVDDEGGAYQAAQHLLALGHREVLVISIRPAQGERVDEHDDRPHSGVSDRRLAGYRRAFADAGIPFREDYVIAADSTREAGEQALRTAWLAGFHPTAVLAMSDIVAIGVLDAADRLELAVPDRLSVVGFDDIPAAHWRRPALTTVHQPGLEKGMRAARLLIDRHAGSNEVEHQMLPANLVVRDSTAPCPATRLQVHPSVQVETETAPQAAI